MRILVSAVALGAICGACECAGLAVLDPGCGVVLADELVECSARWTSAVGDANLALLSVLVAAVFDIGMVALLCGRGEQGPGSLLGR